MPDSSAANRAELLHRDHVLNERVPVYYGERLFGELAVGLRESTWVPALVGAGVRNGIPSLLARPRRVSLLASSGANRGARSPLEQPGACSQYPSGRRPVALSRATLPWRRTSRLPSLQGDDRLTFCADLPSVLESEKPGCIVIEDIPLLLGGEEVGCLDRFNCLANHFRPAHLI